MSTRLLALIVVALAYLPLCACEPSVYAQAAPDFRPGTYRTYGFFQNARFFHDAFPDYPGYATVVVLYLQEAAARELEERGYHPSEQPDLLVVFHVATTEKYGWSWGPAWRGFAYPRQQRSEPLGRLTIDVVDLTRNRLVWSGTAQGEVTLRQLRNPRPPIESAVTALFARFPASPR